MAEMMTKDVSTIDKLRHHAKTIGGVLGAETEFFENKKFDNEYFIEKPLLEYQDITFEKIEKTSLGKSLKNNINKLEARAKGLQSQMTDFRMQAKSKELQIYKKCEENLQQKFMEKQKKSLLIFKEEVQKIKG